MAKKEPKYNLADFVTGLRQMIQNSKERSGGASKQDAPVIPKNTVIDEYAQQNLEPETYYDLTGQDMPTGFTEEEMAYLKGEKDKEIAEKDAQYKKAQAEKEKEKAEKKKNGELVPKPVVITPQMEYIAKLAHQDYDLGELGIDEVELEDGTKRPLQDDDMLTYTDKNGVERRITARQAAKQINRETGTTLEQRRADRYIAQYIEAMLYGAPDKELKDLKEKIDKTLEEDKKYNPKKHAEFKDYFDNRIRYAEDSDFRVGVDASEKLKNAVESNDKELAGKTIEHMKKLAPKYYAENAAELLISYSSMLSEDELKNLEKSIHDDVYNAAKASYGEAEAGEITKQFDAKYNQLKTNRALERNGIKNPLDFNEEDFVEWASKNNIELYYENQVPFPAGFKSKKEGGFLGVGGTDLATSQQLRDAEILYTLAKNNLLRSWKDKEFNAVTSGAIGMAEGMYGGLMDNFGVTEKEHQRYLDAGLDPKKFVGTREAQDSIANQHKVASGIGKVAGFATDIFLGSKVLGAIGATVKGAKILRGAAALSPLAVDMITTSTPIANEAGMSVLDDIAEQNTEYYKKLQTGEVIPEDDILSWFTANAYVGLAGVSSSIMKTTDLFLPDELLLGEKNIISSYNDMLSSEVSAQGEKANIINSKNIAYSILGELTQVGTGMLPNTILAWLTSGSSIAAQSLGQTGYSLSSAISTTINSWAKNPTYWSSFVQTAGANYETAIAEGATEAQAGMFAVLCSLLTSGIEVGSGNEKLFENLAKGSASQKWQFFKNAIEEGGEETLQSITAGLAAKAIYDSDREFFSSTDDKAIINPTLVKDFALGAGGGALMGGAQTAAFNTLNTLIDARNSMHSNLSVGEPTKKINATTGNIEFTADSAIDSAIADVAKANSESAAVPESGKVVPASKKNPVVEVRTDNGKTVSVNGEYATKVQGRQIYVVKGKDIGAQEAYYAIDSTTGLSLAVGETKSVINEQLKELKASGKAVEPATFEDGTENIFAGEVTVPIDFDSLERPVALAKPKYKTFEGTDIEDIFSVEGDNNVSAVKTDVEVAEVDSPAEVDEASAESVDEKIVVPEKKVDKVTYERAFTERKTTAVSESELSGDDVEVGKTITHSDLTQAVIDQALNSNDAATIKAAKDIQRRVYKNTDEMYRAVGRLAKTLGITGNDVIQSRAASIAQRYNDSNFGSTYAEFSNDLRQKFELAGDEIGIQALDYLDSIQAKSGQTGIDTVATDGIEYLESNRNTVVENYISGIQYAFRANGNKNTRFEVYYDNSEGAKRGEWKLDRKGNVTIRINGAKVRGAESATWVLTHELFHGAAKNNPGIVDRVIDTFREIGIYDDSKFDAYKAEYEAAEGKELTDEYIKEEIAADLMMDVMGNEELTAMFAQKSTKEDLNFIARFFRRFVDAIKKVFGGNKKYQQYVYDAEKLLGVFERAIKNNIDKASGKEYNNETRYAVLPRPNDGVEWARGLLTDAEITQFYSNIADLKKLKFKFRKAGDGSYIFETDRSIILTDGKWVKPTILHVFTINNKENVSQIKECLYDWIKKPFESNAVKSSFEEAVYLINIVFGDGSVTFGAIEDNKEIFSEQNKRRKGTNSRKTYSGASANGENQIKSSDTEYLELAKNPEKNEARLREMVEEAAKKAMPKSLVVDKNGNLLKVYHGSAKKFTEFLHKYLNAHGNSHGRGFYFTENKSLAEGYATEDGQLLEGYLNIEKPLSEDKVTIKKSDLVKLIKATCEAEAKALVEEGYSNISEALRDTWLSNYTDTYSANSMADVYREVADIVYSANDNDVEIIAELTNAGAGNESVLTLTRDILGYDGVIFTNDLGYHEYVALVSNQFKSADPVTYDDDGNVIPLSERFNLDKRDIRYAVTSTPANENSVFDDKQRKDVIRKLSTVAKQNGVARLDKDSFVTDAMGILEGALQTGIVSDGVVDELARCLYDYSREDAGDADLAGTYKDIRERINKVGKIYVPESVKNDIPDYDTFRKQFGTLLTTTDETALEVDKLYNDLKMDYPDIFTEDLVAGDRLQKLADVLAEARKYKANDGLTHTSEIHSFDDVKTDFVEMADEMLDDISASVGIELVEESDVYAELAESGKDISSIEIPNELIMKDKLSDKQIQALLQKVKDRRNEYMYVQEGDEGSRRVKKYPNADKEYKFLQRLFSAETEYKEAQKKLRDAEKKSKSRDAEVDNKRLTDFTKGIANAFGFDSDASKTADIGRGFKGLYDAVSEYIKTGDDAALNKMVASVGSIAEKIADYSTSDVDIDKVGGYILDSFSNVTKGAKGDVTVASANDIASLENGTMAALEGIQSVAEADYSGEVEVARKALYDATAKLRAQQIQPYFETVMDKFFDMQEAEIAAAEARFEKELADERAKGEEAVEAEKAKAEDRVVGEKMGYEREAAEARRKSDEKLAEERTKRREEVAEVRKRSKERVEKMREDAREARERKSEKRNRRKKEEKLLRVINRLRKVKTNAETQEIIKNVIGDLDYLGISIMDDNKIRLEKLRERYLEKSQDENFIREPGIEERLSRLDNRQISDLSADELAHILEMATALEHQIAYDKSVMIHEQAVSKYRAARSGISGVLDTKGAKYDKAIPGAWNKYSTSLRAPRRFFKKIFGYDKNNKMFQLTEEINNGQKKSLMIHQESERPFTALTLDKEIKKFTGKKATEYDTGITTIKGTKIKITPAQKVALYLSAKNHDFLRHAAGGGIKFPDIKLLKDGKVKEAYAKGETVSLKPSEIHRITSGLTAYEQRWADAAEKYFNETSRKYINEASLEMYGYEIANVEDYFPIMTNKNFNATEPESLVRNATLEGKGFLKDRVHASNQVLLEDVTSVLERHIKDVSDFAGLSAPIKNFSKAYTATVNYADGSRMSVREAIEQTWGPAATKYIDNLLSDLQTPRKAERGWAEKLRSKRAAAIMTMNIPVTLGNFANYFHAGSKVGAKALVKGIFGGKVDTEIVAKYTPYLEARMQGYTTKEFGDVAKGDSFGVKKSLGAKIVNMMQFVDILCTKATWNASKAYVDSKFTDLKKGSDEYYKAVAKVFDGIIEDTQVNDLVYQKADILKSTNFFVNELTMFKSELLKNLDMIRDAGGEYAATVKKYGGLKNTLREAKRGNKEVRDVLVNTRRVMVSQATAMVFVQVVDALVKGLWFKKWSYKDEEEDEVTADSLIETGIEQFFMGFLAMFPGAEDTVNLFGNLAKGAAGLAGIEIPVDFEWYGMNANVFEMINDFADGATNIIDTIGKYQKGDVSEKSLLVSGWDFLSENIAPALGVPSENIENLVKGTVLNVVEASGGKYYGKYQRYKYEEDGASYYTRQKMISTALKAKNAGDMDAYNAIREDMIKSKFASAKTFDKGIENLETAIELGTYGDVFKKAVEYDEKAGNVYERDGSGEAAFRYEVAHHDRYFAENAVELVKDLPKDKQDEALSIAAELIRSSDHKKTRGQQLVIDNFNAVGDEGIFKFSAEYNDMSKTVDGEKKTADFEFDDYVSYVEEYRDATEYLRLAIFGTDKDVADYGKAITDKYAGEAWLMYAKDAPADDASDKEKAEYYKKASKEAQHAILDKYKAKYFGDYGADYEVFGDIESGRNVASDLYTWDESGKNAYSKEIYSKADDLIGKAEVLIEDLPESERDEAMQLVTDYAKGFAYTERKGGTLLAEAYDRVYGGVEDPELRADSVFDMYSEYSNISKTVDDKEYKSDFTVGDYIEYNKEIADADELVRLALFGGKGSAEAKELKAKYKNEPWMKLVEAAEGKSSMSDKEKLELYTDIRNDITNNIKMPYEHKYIKATSSGNADIDNFFVERDAAYNALDYSKDDNGEFTDGESKGKYNYYSRTNSYVNNSLDLIDKNPLLSAAQKKEQKDKLGEYVRGLKYSPTKGQKYIMAEFDDYAKSAEEYNKYIDAEISRTGDNTLEKMHWDSAESKTTSKSKDSIPYTVTYSQPQYAEMVGHMNKGEEYAALYIFGTDKELREYKATLTATEKAWVNEGVSELNKEAKKIDKYIAKGILSKESRDAYLYYALVGKIKSAVRAGYRETVFDKYRKDADTPKGYYVKYNP